MSLREQKGGYDMLNGEFLCVKSVGSVFTEGKIYEFENGITKTDSGRETSTYSSLEEFHKSNQCFTFVEFKLPQPHKSMLKDGDYVVDGYGTEYIVSLKFGMFIDKDTDYNYIADFDDNLNFGNSKEDNINEHWRDGVLIAKRTEKSKEQIELEEIEQKQRELAEEQKKLADRMNELKERL